MASKDEAEKAAQEAADFRERMTSLNATVTSLKERVTSLERELSSARDVERMLNEQV